MAKRDIDRHGKFTRSYIHKMFLERDINQTANYLYGKTKDRKKKMGIRHIVMNAYELGGRDAALKAIEEANKRIGQIVYTEETLDTWIAEELSKRSRDDDDGR